jgi:excisionase family DNA binding protein
VPQTLVKSEAVRLLPIPGAAAYLSTTIWAVRRLVWDKKIPVVRLGKRILIDKIDLDKFIEASKTA